MTRYAIVVDLNRCTGCRACEVACKVENDIPLGVSWNKVLEVGPTGTFPDIELYWLPMMCQQCEDAPCIDVCPTGASYRNEDNVVLIDKGKCIGCQYCLMACPYDARMLNPKEGVMEKCTLCNHLTSVGKLPSCVHHCCSEARYFGDLDDPNSAPSKALAAAAEADPDSIHKLTSVGNNPSTSYILSKKIATWKEAL